MITAEWSGACAYFPELKHSADGWTFTYIITVWKITNKTRLSMKRNKSQCQWITTFGHRRVITMSNPRITNIACFLAGAAACLLVSKSLNKKARRNGAVGTNDEWSLESVYCSSHIYCSLSQPDGATAEGKDLSLFYGDKKELTTIKDSRKFLPSDVYGELVRKCVVCCVDIVVVRINPLGKKECVLVERASEPAKGVWWWPGGRLLKGETFFDAAIRKTQQETGLKDVTPIQV